MLSPGLQYEEDRLCALARHGILDTPAESEYEDIVRLAASLCDVPLALISLVDRERQWFKAQVGLPDVSETARCLSFCTYAIEQTAELFVVEDALQDARFAANPLVLEAPHIRFYAGASIHSEEGYPLGTLCVIDTVPRALSDRQRRDLLALKRQVELLLRLRLRVRQAEARNRQLLESSGDAVFLLDEAGRVLELNPVASRLIGREAREVLGTRLEALALDGERGRVREALGELLAQGSVRALDVGLRSARGERLSLDLTGALQEGTDARRLLVVAQDLTEKRMLERASLQNDRLASLGVLAAGIAHEINNPIAYLLTNMGLLREWMDELEQRLLRLPGPTAHARQFLGEARQVLSESIVGCRRIRDIVRDMRFFSHASDESLESVDVNASLDFALRMAEAQCRGTARLEKACDAALPPVLASESRLTQVFLNLIVNALQAMGSSSPQHNVLRVSSRQEADVVRVDVSDTGHGIPPEVLPRIFDPFFTTKPAGTGTGLGLSISHALVRKMGGELRVSSEPGRGTTFSLLLPRGAAEPSAALAS
ncbi:sensor histidine kinase [Archangium primigenium]|uniref:sensor histidine kinase n=1 Tax=[Archangium] primigenium TaxID=2792470 RepID=UPI00195733CD|nr:sensor histidine kinase [Archangium primigenium]MBM7112896.1 PAS domain S-box protein [Archangium primigenium]